VADKDNGKNDEWKGYFYAILLLATSVLQTLILGQYFQRMFVVGMRTRTTLVSCIYRKALLLSNSARKGLFDEAELVLYVSSSVLWFETIINLTLFIRINCWGNCKSDERWCPAFHGFNDVSNKHIFICKPTLYKSSVLFSYLALYPCIIVTQILMLPKFLFTDIWTWVRHSFFSCELGCLVGFVFLTINFVLAYVLVWSAPLQIGLSL